MSSLSVLGPTPIHAPRPRPLTTSIGIGTHEVRTTTRNVETQGGPPDFELSSFLLDLSLTANSSPLPRPLVSMFSPIRRRVPDAHAPVGSPLPTRVTICSATSTRDEVEHVDVVTSAGCTYVDRAVQAVVDSCDAVTACNPPVDAAVVVSQIPPDDLVVPTLDVASPIGSCPTVDPPDNFSVDGSLVACSVASDVASASEAGVAGTSTIGSSLIDSHDELLASRLPGYLNSF